MEFRRQKNRRQKKLQSSDSHHFSLLIFHQSIGFICSAQLFVRLNPSDDGFNFVF